MSSNRFVLPLVTVVIGSSLGVLASAPRAYAAPDPAAALDLPAGVTATTEGSSAVATAPFNDLPARDGDYLVLSTGVADQVMRDAPLAIDDPMTPANERDPDIQLSTDVGQDGAPDQSSLTLSVAPSTEAGCLYIDFSMATDEAVRVYVPETPGDSVSITRRADPATEYAMNTGRGYFAQAGWAAQPRKYTVNAINYWHEPGDRSDVLDSQLEVPRLHRWTALNRVTTKDTARIPLDLTNGPDVIDLVVADHGNGDLDTAALVDNVRLGTNCDPGTGVYPVHPYGEGSIKGERRVGYPLSYDPIPSTSQIERYDAADNGWGHPEPAAPVELRFRWYRTTDTYAYNSNMANWTPIPDADRQSYVPTNLDRGKRLIVLVTGVVDGRRMETFPPTGDAIANPSQWYVTLPIDYGVFQDGSTPTIVSDGSPKVGETLSALPVPTRPLQDSWSYQWYADGSSISGATSSTLVLAAGQRGKKITVKATARRSGFDNRSWTSAATIPVAGDQMESVGQPTVIPPSDAPRVGDTLTADPGPGWPENTAFTYQWKRNGANISGATTPTYTAVFADAAKDLSVQVSGSKPGYDPVSAMSPSILVQGAPMLGAEPTITGTPRVGQRLTGSAAGWSPTGSNLTYSWHAGDTEFQSGTSRYLTVPASAVGKEITLRVRGMRTGYQPLTRDSAPTTSVMRGILNSDTPKIYGRAEIGYTLTLSSGSWGPSGVRRTYQWKVGRKLVTGRAGKRSTFRIPRTARGKRVTVIVTGSLAGYTTVKKTSARTAKVTR